MIIVAAGILQAINWTIWNIGLFVFWEHDVCKIPYERTWHFCFKVIKMRIIEVSNKESYSGQILSSISILHCESMPQTVTSMRGIKATEGLYRRLIRTGGIVFCSVNDEEIIGVISFTMNYSRLASLSSFAIKPFSWIGVVRKLGLFDVLVRLFDSKKLMHNFKTLGQRFFYISTLFVSESNRGTGIGSELLSAAKEVALSSGVPLFVDTELDNIRARIFYVDNNFIEVGRTKKSILFRSRD